MNGDPKTQGFKTNFRNSVRKRRSVFALGSLLFLALLLRSASASHFVYMVDTSASMRWVWKGENVVMTVAQDIERALSGSSPLIQEGDRIHIWSFDLKVQSELDVEVRANSAMDMRRQILDALDRLHVKLFGKTSLAVPLTRALEQFARPDQGNLSMIFYTDGKISIRENDVESILRRYNHDFKTGNRLANLLLFQFGDASLPESTGNLIAQMGGRARSPGTELKPTARAPSAPATPVVAPDQTVISVSPEAIHFVSPVGTEITKPVPIEFTLTPPRSGLSVALSLQTTNLTTGMSITTTTDRLATEGKQSVSFLIRNPQPGHFSAKLKLSSSVPVHPDLIPVDIDILPATPDNVGIQFFPERVSGIVLPAVNRWQKLPAVGVSLFYQDRLRNTRARFEAKTPQGIAIQMTPGDSPEKPIASGGVFLLGNIGTVAGFEIRSTSTGLVDQPLEAELSIVVQPGQNVSSVGTNSLSVPFRFSSATEVTINTQEIALGDIPRDVDKMKGTLILIVQGTTDGSKLRVVKQGQGLAGLEIRPSEILLEPGTRSVDLEFAGFAERRPGPVEGEFVLVPERPNPSLSVPVSPITVRGSVAEPSKILVNVDNPMVAGQPLVIHARFDSGAKQTLTALIQPPKSPKTFELELADSGSAEDNDAKADDGVYSAVFRETDQLGLYQIRVSGTDSDSQRRTASIKVPIHFQGPREPLAGAMSRRQPDESIEFQPKIISDYPGTVTLDIESAPEGAALNTYLSSKRLEPGTNSVGLLFRLTPEAGPGVYQYDLYLTTQLIDNKRARIPVAVDLQVESVFQYFLKLVAVAVTAGVVITLSIVVPWNRVAWINRLRGKAPARLEAPHPFDRLD